MPDDLVVEIPTSEPEGAGKKIEGDKKVETQPVDPLEDLKGQLAEARKQQAAETARADAASSEARQRSEEAERVKQERDTATKSLTESNVSVLDNALAAAQTEADSYQREQQTALEAGEFAKAADFGRKMAKAEARAAQLESGRADLEYRNKADAEKADKAKEAKPEPKPSDPFEATMVTLTPRTAKWMRDQKTAGRDYITDPKMNAKAASAHYEAVSEGYVPDTDGYFEFCETKLGLREEPKAVRNGQKRENMASAPVSREGTLSGGQLSPTQVRLTPGEQARATDGTIVWNFSDEKTGAVKGEAIGVKEYARRKMELQKQGAYDRTGTE